MHLSIQSQLTSDNQSGICPEAWQGLLAANASGHVPSYGNDVWTSRAADMLREQFETDNCEVFFCFTGTAANALTIAHLCQSYHSVICHETAHLETDECGAPEFFANGAKLLLGAGAEGKLSPEAVQGIIDKRQDIHYPRPRVLSITQATELGTVYTPPQIQALTQVAKNAGLRVHMDGARFANAVAHLDVKPREITWEAGVNALCFGGTKNGLPGGEAVLFFDRQLARDFDYRCKQVGQLASKMRYLTAPWTKVLESASWLKHAQHANNMARLLATHVAKTDGATILYPVEANSVFLMVSADRIKKLRLRGWTFYTFIGGGVRLMTSWDTTPDDIDRFCADLAASVRE